MPRGISLKETDLAAAVRQEDPEMGARSWGRVLRDLRKRENLIGYATYMGPSSATAVQSALGWHAIFNKFQPVQVYMQEDWENLKRRSDFTLTEAGNEPPNPLYLRRREQYTQKELYEIKAIAKELDLVKADKDGNITGYSRNQLIEMIVQHEMEAD